MNDPATAESSCGSDQEDEMPKRITLPVLPMRETVVFPGVALPISAGRPGTIEAIETALRGDRRLFAVCQRSNVDDVTPEVLYELGVVVRVLQVQKGTGGFQLLIQGEDRARSLSYAREGDAMLRAEVWVLDEDQPADPQNSAFVALDRELRDRAGELGQRRGMSAEALSQILQGVDSPAAFADLVAFYLDISAQEKQALLELVPLEERMRRVLVGVERDLLRIDAQQEIQQKVQEELGERQREMMLREQMKAIQRELGDEDEASDLEEIKERIARLELPEDARKEIDRELNRLQRTNPQSAEYQVIRTYLDYVVELPWSERTEDKIDLPEADRILAEDHYGLEDVKDRVLEFLAVRKLQMERAAQEAEEEAAQQTADDSNGKKPEAMEAEVISTSGSEAAAAKRDPNAPETNPSRAKAVAVGRGPILLFVGPPGVGKTSIAKSIARALGRKYVRI